MYGILLAGDAQTFHQNGGAAVGGHAQGHGQGAVVGHSHHIFQQIIEVASHGERLDVGSLLAVLNDGASFSACSV